MIARIFKVFVVCCWLALLVFLVQRDFFVSTLESDEQAALIQAKYQQYYGVYLQDKRIGYIMEDVRPDGENSLHILQEASLRLKVLNSVQPIKMNLTATVGNGLQLRTFEFLFSSPFYSTTANGRVEGNTVHFTLDTGGATIQDTITLPAPPVLPLNQRSYLLSKLHEKGDKLKVPFFDPFSLTARTSVITYNGEEKKLLNERIYHLRHFTESYSGMQVNFWLDNEGKVIRERSPAGFVFQAEPKFKAMDIQDSGDELLSAVAVQYTGKLLEKNNRVAAFRLQFPEDAEVTLNGGRQHFAEGRLTLTKEEFPPLLKDNELISGNSCVGDEPTLSASRYVQSDNPDIKEKAKEIVGEIADPVRQVSLLAEWVYENIEKRPVIGLPDALTTLKSGRGDCNEHAALFAALARSLNIPTVIAAGVTLHNDAFYYHAWNEVCLNGQWVSLDTTVNQLPADLYHIRFTRGDLEGQLAIGALIGKLQIEILPAQE
ncbi:Transglutaminase-like superfamily protein [Candidatus Electrothrix aarhusensis]|uniref:Transglutaminase-like superfamily protein n=1 Tax=Candidatus Electrothrix aarhusensis TaxID=1859131 RepID=A0A3S3SPG9_9BACT|nr:Transglutaminase-like superfamily protein [Candidatus Electrothrix aarhusensis]